MDKAQQADAFAEELDKLILHFTQEFDLSLRDVIGVLETKKLVLVHNQLAGQVPTHNHPTNEEESEEGYGEQQDGN